MVVNKKDRIEFCHLTYIFHLKSQAFLALLLYMVERAKFLVRIELYSYHHKQYFQVHTRTPVHHICCYLPILDPLIYSNQ